VRIERGKTVVLDAPGIVAYADGERVWELPAHVDVVPAAVRVFV
jgi:diacylglycerol kinase (ATP)